MSTFDPIIVTPTAAPDEAGELDEDFPADDDEGIDIELVVFDMAGTTVQDDGLVEKAFELAARRTGIATDDADSKAEGIRMEEALAYVRETMGQSKIEVFRALTVDEDAAVAGNAAFEIAYGELVAGGGITAVDGAQAVIEELRAAGVKVALTTGFSRVTQDAILTALGWEHLADVSLSPAEAGRGRPYPDLVLTAMLRTGASSVGAVVVVGDTASDMMSGVNAGAGLVVGVLTGAHGTETLEAAGADVVVDSVRDLPGLFGLR